MPGLSKCFLCFIEFLTVMNLKGRLEYIYMLSKDLEEQIQTYTEKEMGNLLTSE